MGVVRLSPPGVAVNCNFWNQPRKPNRACPILSLLDELYGLLRRFKMLLRGAERQPTFFRMLSQRRSGHFPILVSRAAPLVNLAI